jgi:hypothetical protein
MATDYDMLRTLGMSTQERLAVECILDADIESEWAQQKVEDDRRYQILT